MMGCCPSSSSRAVGPVNRREAWAVGDDAVFTSRQRKLVVETWKHLSKDLTGHGRKVFSHIFTQLPQVKELFPFRNKQGSDLLKDVTFRGHASRFMQAVAAVVDNIADPEKALSTLLIGLGRQHVHFMGFRAEYFDAFTEAMLHVWAEELGAKRFTEEVKGSWGVVFNFLMSKLKEGYRLALLQQQLEDAGKQQVMEGTAGL